MYINENYYVFIEHTENEETEKSILRVYQNINWYIEPICGTMPYDLENESFDREDVIDDIMDYLRDTFDYVQEINYSDIDDYLEEE
jgi:hypothetical protein